MKRRNTYKVMKVRPFTDAGIYRLCPAIEMVYIQADGFVVMNQQLFRKSSIERVSSPEQLNDYIKVTNSGVWLVLAAVIMLLVGTCI